MSSVESRCPFCVATHDWRKAGFSADRDSGSRKSLLTCVIRHPPARTRADTGADAQGRPRLLQSDGQASARISASTSTSNLSRFLHGIRETLGPPFAYAAINYCLLDSWELLRTVSVSVVLVYPEPTLLQNTAERKYQQIFHLTCSHGTVGKAMGECAREDLYKVVGFPVLALAVSDRRLTPRQAQQ